MTIDPELAIRATSLYGAILLLAAAWLAARPDRRHATGALLALAWNVPAIAALHLVATRAAWWHFTADGGLFFGMPVDLWLAWALLWGPIPALAMPRVHLGVIVVIGIAVDLIAMPLAAPVVSLGPDWIVGEGIGMVACVVPGQLLARFTRDDRRLRARTTILVLAFAGTFVGIVPAAIVAAAGGSLTDALPSSRWLLSLAAQALFIPVVIGLTAVQEFVARGHGTPLPYDPPRRLVTSGIYAYVANPMQLSMTLLFPMLGLMMHSWHVAAAGVMAYVYSSGIAGWDEDEDLRGRFGPRWNEYRGAVRRWVPRLRPRFPVGAPPAKLYVSETCDICTEVGHWYRARGAEALTILAAEQHPTGALTRITYESGDGSYRATGIRAVGRALEHVHLGWALLGMAIRLPLIAPFIQLLNDASGGHARPAAARIRTADSQL